MDWDFQKLYTVEHAREILRRAKLKCKHNKNLIFKRGSSPNYLEDTEQPIAWSYIVQCADCSAHATGATSGPICVPCCSPKGAQVMRLITTKKDPTSRDGKVFIYTCDKCKKNEEITFKSSW
jgi:hypothetical protein